MSVNDDAKRLEDMLDGIVEQIVGAYQAWGLDLPERRYWTFSQPAADCEQMVVSFQQAYIGPPGDEATQPQRCNAPQTAQLDIQVLRCIPTPKGPRGNIMPTAAEIQAASIAQARDVMVLLDVAANLDTWGGLPGQGLGVIATVDAGEPQGGFQGPTMHLTVAIP